MARNRESVPKDILALRRLMDMGNEGISRLIVAIQQMGPTLRPYEERAQLLLAKVKSDLTVDQLEEILDDGLDTFVGFRVANELTAEEAYHLCDEYLSQADITIWSEEYRRKWREAEQILVKLFGLPELELEQKAFQLTSQRPHWIVGLKIFSEIRPLFDTSGNKLLANLLVNSLQLQYKDGSRNRTMYFSLDPIDLEKLQQQIERCKSKHKELNEQFVSTGRPLLMMGS